MAVIRNLPTYKGWHIQIIVWKYLIDFSVAEAWGEV